MAFFIADDVIGPFFHVIYCIKDFLYHGIKTPIEKSVENEAIAESFDNFEVFCDRCKELFRVLYVPSQTNLYFKEKIKIKVSLSYGRSLPRYQSTEYAYDYPLSFEKIIS